MPQSPQAILERIFPACCLLLCCVFFTPFFGVEISILPALHIHMASYLVLGIFFELPELTLNVRCLHKAHDLKKLKKGLPYLKKVFVVRYVLTHYIGPCSGIMAVMSGLYLVHLGGYSFTEGWLFWILIAAMIGFYKGMNQHNFYVKQLFYAVNEKSFSEESIKVLQKCIMCPFDQVLIFSEFPTYLFIYITAYYKPDWFVNPFHAMTAGLEKALDPVLLGLILVGAGAGFIPVLRQGMKRWSYIYVQRFQN
jgi:hypothetical protein